MTWAFGTGIATLDGMLDIVRGPAHRTARRAVIGVCVLLAVVALGAAVLWPASPPPAGVVADRILASPRVTLADGARTDIEDTSAGVPARSVTRLSAAMLEGMLNQAATYTFRVSEIAGGPPRSPHHAGLAFDADLVGGRPVQPDGPVERQFMAGCRANGATEVRHEVDHVHCEWPR